MTLPPIAKTNLADAIQSVGVRHHGGQGDPLRSAVGGRRAACVGLHPQPAHRDQQQRRAVDRRTREPSRAIRAPKNVI